MRESISGCTINSKLSVSKQYNNKISNFINERGRLTSSINGIISLANWEDEDERGIIEFVKQPLSRPEMKYEVGAEPLQTSAWRVSVAAQL